MSKYRHIEVHTRCRWLAAGPCRLIFGAALAVFAAAPSVARDAAAEPAPKAVRIETTDELGPVYADSRGRTLYTWRGDKEGESNCNGDSYDQGKGAGDTPYFLPDADKRPTCKEVWPAFTAKANSKPVGRWSTLTRKDGSLQWVYDKQPVYTFVHDQRSGELNGLDSGVIVGRQPLFVPMLSPPNVTVRPTRLGRVLATVDGSTLYARADETTKQLACTASCEQTWIPLSAPASAADQPMPGWSVLLRPDGTNQWAFQNQPLYTYVNDTRFGLNGMKEASWSVVRLSTPLAPPADITVQWTADGQVFADSEGKTLYVWFCSEDAPDRLGCDRPGSTLVYWKSICGPAEQCVATWKPAIAPKGAKPVGRTWSIVTLDPSGARQFALPGEKGLQVWAYRGKPLYTFARDREPGDMDGNNYMSFFQWGYKMVRAEDAYGLRNLQ